MLPFSLMGATFYGFDQVSVELYKLDLVKQINKRVEHEASQTRPATADMMVRQALRDTSSQFKQKGLPFDYTLTRQPERIDVNVSTLYKTRLSKFVGKPDLKADVKLSFDVAR
jgi:hypothetical protein